jgi:hypothetical protein
LDNDFRLYLPEKYVEKHPEEVFKKKTELAVDILEDRLKAYDGRIPRNRITLLTDATYAVKLVLNPSRKKGLIYVGKFHRFTLNSLQAPCSSQQCVQGQ